MDKKECAISDCQNRIYSRGWCRAHYLRWQRYGDPTQGLPRYTVCTVEGCDDKPYARSWCNRHYLRWRTYGNPLGGRADQRDTCLVDDCERPPHRRALCSPHYQKLLKYGDPLTGKSESVLPQSQEECTVNGCQRRIRARGWCSAHYRRWQHHGDPLGGPPEPVAPVTSQKCSIDGCTRAQQARGWCPMHYQRWLSHGDPLVVKKRRKPVNGPNRFINNNGYVVIYSLGERVLEHRQVMEQKLNRQLYPFENVHHKNGIKTDNHPDNLEVWVKVQPTGQRPEDLIAFIIKHYPNETRTALSEAVT